MPERTILGWLLIGLVAGVLGKIIMPGKDPGGIIVTILIGIAGALLAGFGRDKLRLGDTDENYALRADRLEEAIKADLAQGYQPCALVATTFLSCLNCAMFPR